MPIDLVKCRFCGTKRSVYADKCPECGETEGEVIRR